MSNVTAQSYNVNNVLDVFPNLYAIEKAYKEAINLLDAMSVKGANKKWTGSTLDVSLEKQSLYGWLQDTKKTWNEAKGLRAVEEAKALFALDADEVIDDRYLPTLETFKQVLVVRSQKGTGKTTRLKKTLKDEARVLVIGHRKTLLRQTAKALDLAYYEDLGALNSPRLAVTLDSLYKVDLSRFKGAVIVLDEFTQVLQHLHSDTLKTPRVAYESLTLLIRHSAKTYALDADLSNVEVNWLTKLVGRENVHIIHNVRKTERKKFIETDKLGALKRLKEELRSGTRCYVFCDSRAMVEDILYILKQEGIEVPILEITQKTGNSPEVQKFLCDVDIESVKYQLLIGSPTMGTGVDISNSHFDLVFMFATAMQSQSPTELLQGISRVRKPNTMTVVCCFDGYEKSLETDKGILKSLITYGSKPDLFRVSSDDLCFVPVDQGLHNGYLDLYAALTAKRNHCINNLKAVFKYLVDSEGHKLTFEATEKDPARPYYDEGCQKAKTCRKESRVQAVLDALDITDEEAEVLKALKEKQGISDDQQAQLDRYSIKRSLKTDPTAEDVEWFLYGKGFEAVRNFVDMHTDLATLQALDELDALKGKYASQQRRCAQRAMLLKTLLPEYLYQEERLSGAKLKKWGYDAVLQENAEAIYALLGFKVQNSPMKTLGLILKAVGQGKEEFWDENGKRYYCIWGLEKMTAILERHQEDLKAKAERVREQAQLLRKVKGASEVPGVARLLELVPSETIYDFGGEEPKGLRVAIPEDYETHQEYLQDMEEWECYYQEWEESYDAWSQQFSDFRSEPSKLLSLMSC